MADIVEAISAIVRQGQRGRYLLLSVPLFSCDRPRARNGYADLPCTPRDGTLILARLIGVESKGPGSE